MSTKELIKTYTYDDIHADRRDERVKVVKGRTVIELGTRAATSFVGNLYRVYDYSVKSYKQLLLVGVAKQPLDNGNGEFEETIYEEAMENAWVDPMVKIVLDDIEDSRVPINEDYFIDLCIVLSEMMKVRLLMTDEEMGLTNINC
jgi:hypothetical protein